MKSRNNQTLRKTILDNFQISSIKINSVANSTPNKSTPYKERSTQLKEIRLIEVEQSIDKEKLKQQEINKQKYYQNDLSKKGFFINGFNYFQDVLIMEEEAQVMEDCYSVKGDYFYLKRKEIVKVRAKVGQYSEIKYQRFVGYFPSHMFRLIRA